MTLGATLADTDNAPLAGRVLTFRIGTATTTATTDAAGHAVASMALAGPAGASVVEVSFAGDALFGGGSTNAPFTVERENTIVTVTNAVASRSSAAVARATLAEADAAPLGGRVLRFEVQEKIKGQLTWVTVGTATTDPAGAATFIHSGSPCEPHRPPAAGGVRWRHQLPRIARDGIGLPKLTDTAGAGTSARPGHHRRAAIAHARRLRALAVTATARR